jgi:hypothetical protein
VDPAPGPILLRKSGSFAIIATLWDGRSLMLLLAILAFYGSRGNVAKDG